MDTAKTYGEDILPIAHGISPWKPKSTDCYMIILLSSLEIHDENLIIQLAEPI